MLVMGCAASPGTPAVAPVAPADEVPVQPPLPPRPVCLVLSVGAEQGLAHIGFVRAVRERGIHVDCVVGTSMGALVGALFAEEPERDVAESYRAVFSEYQRAAESEAQSRMTWAALIGAGAVVATGGGAAVALGAGAGGGALGAWSIRKVEWQRLRDVLGTSFEGRTIESLPRRFVTSHQHLTDSGAQARIVTGGDLATEVARSIANPLIFGDLKAEAGARIDPGLDRVAAVPVQMACDVFPEHQFVVSNVTEDEVYVAERMTCPYQQVKIPNVAVDPVSAMTGGAGFDALVEAGYEAAKAGIDWSLLPDDGHPARALDGAPLPIEKVRARLSVKVDAAADGWDALGGKPDIVPDVLVRACPDCEGYGTSASLRLGGDERENSLEADWDLGLLLLRRGFHFDIALSDIDGAVDDEMGAVTLTYEGPGAEARAALPGIEVILRFEEVPRSEVPGLE